MKKRPTGKKDICVTNSAYKKESEVLDSFYYELGNCRKRVRT